jgi:hypothetical protein
VAYTVFFKRQVEALERAPNRGERRGRGERGLQVCKRLIGLRLDQPPQPILLAGEGQRTKARLASRPNLARLSPALH